ncbi:hypothetical protein J6590_048991 [Homalodisca vitripennis]|nr:hypothetical protein J6590_048991 [Homalodisca vitripennis]
MQEQLEELSPIKDLLRITQQKLKETEQMHNIALETIADITKKLENANNEKDRLHVTTPAANSYPSRSCEGDLACVSYMRIEDLKPADCAPHH